MALLFLTVALSTFALGFCGNFTITEEVWLDVEVKDFDGPGEDYRGRIVIGVFGETCPMTAMNFQAIAKGHRRGKVGIIYCSVYINGVNINQGLTSTQTTVNICGLTLHGNSVRYINTNHC